MLSASASSGSWRLPLVFAAPETTHDMRKLGKHVSGQRTYPWASSSGPRSLCNNELALANFNRVLRSILQLDERAPQCMRSRVSCGALYLHDAGAASAKLTEHTNPSLHPPAPASTCAFSSRLPQQMRVGGESVRSGPAAERVAAAP